MRLLDFLNCFPEAVIFQNIGNDISSGKLNTIFKKTVGKNAY